MPENIGLYFSDVRNIHQAKMAARDKFITLTHLQKISFAYRVQSRCVIVHIWRIVLREVCRKRFGEMLNYRSD